MNKYQEALERVKDTIKDLRDLKYEPHITDEDIEILQEAIDKAQSPIAILGEQLDLSNVRILWEKRRIKK